MWDLVINWGNLPAEYSEYSEKTDINHLISFDNSHYLRYLCDVLWASAIAECVRKKENVEFFDQNGQEQDQQLYKISNYCELLYLWTKDFYRTFNGTVKKFREDYKVIVKDRCRELGQTRKDFLATNVDFQNEQLRVLFDRLQAKLQFYATVDLFSNKIVISPVMSMYLQQCTYRQIHDKYDDLCNALNECDGYWIKAYQHRKYSTGKHNNRCVAVYLDQNNTVASFSGYLDCHDKHCSNLIHELVPKGWNTLQSQQKQEEQWATIVQICADQNLQIARTNEDMLRFTDQYDKTPLKVAYLSDHEKFDKRDFSCCERKILSSVLVAENGKLYVKFKVCNKCRNALCSNQPKPKVYSDLLKQRPYLLKENDDGKNS